MLTGLTVLTILQHISSVYYILETNIMLCQLHLKKLETVKLISEIKKKTQGIQEHQVIHLRETAVKRKKVLKFEKR